MEKCKVQDPNEEITLEGHCWKRNHKMAFTWDGEWYCKWCNEKTSEDVLDIAVRRGYGRSWS